MEFYEQVIADFGGYKAAKKVTENEGARMLYNIEALNGHLLKYRRANGIFEVGDKVVFVMDYHSAMICLYGDGCELHADVRHATDEEIAAGHRL